MFGMNSQIILSNVWNKLSNKIKYCLKSFIWFKTHVLALLGVKIACNLILMHILIKEIASS